MKYFLVLASLLITYSCKDPSQCPNKFKLPANTTPYKEEFKVGDTLTIIAKFHKELYEYNTDRTYNLESVNMAPGLGIFRLDRDSSASTFKTKKYFELIESSKYSIEWFTGSSGSSQLNGEFNFDKDTFDLKINLIPNTTGIYYMRFGSSIERSRQDFPGKCRKQSFVITTAMNEGRDGNIHLLEESPNPHYNDWVLQKPQERFHDTGGFCFRVVE